MAKSSIHYGRECVRVVNDAVIITISAVSSLVTMSSSSSANDIVRHSSTALILAAQASSTPLALIDPMPFYVTLDAAAAIRATLGLDWAVREDPATGCRFRQTACHASAAAEHVLTTRAKQCRASLCENSLSALRVGGMSFFAETNDNVVTDQPLAFRRPHVLHAPLLTSSAVHDSRYTTVHKNCINKPGV